MTATQKSALVVHLEALGYILGVDATPAPPVLQAGDRIRITHCSDRTLPLRGCWTVDQVCDDFVTLYGTSTALSHKLFGDRWELVPHDVTVVS